MRKYSRRFVAGMVASAAVSALAISPMARAAIQFNEVMVDAFDVNATQDFIELRSTTGGVESLGNLTLLMLEGDAGAATGPGAIDRIQTFTGFSTGTNGLFLRHSFPVTPSPAPAQETVIDNVSWTHENLAITYLLVDGFTGTLDQDLDTDNDGALDVTPWASVVDAFGVLDGNTQGAGDRAYATQFGGPVFNQAVQGTVPRAVFRAPDGTYHGAHHGTGGIDPIGGPYITDDSDSVENGYVLSPGNLNNPVTMSSQAWAGTAGANWHNTANWKRGFIPGLADDVAMFYGINGSPVNLGSDATVGTLSFNGGDHTIAAGGGTLTFQSTAGVSLIGVAYGSSSIAAPVVINNQTIASVARAQSLTISGAIGGVGEFRKYDAGTLTLSGANTYSGGTLVNTGLLRLTGAGTLGTGPVAVNTGTLQVENNTTLGGIVSTAPRVGTVAVGDGANPASLTANHYRIATLNVRDGSVAVVAPNAGDAGVSVVGALNFNTSGRLDLKDNKLIVNTPNMTGTWVGFKYDGVLGLVDDGRGSAGNALWNGTSGIVTSDPRAIGMSNLLSIGVAKVGEIKKIADAETATFGGQAVLGSDTVAMVTWGGDATLDGQINIDDYGRIDANVAQSGLVYGWYNGDFNYDGQINIDDYGIIDGNIGRQGTPFSTGAGTVAEGVAAVPEPSSLLLLALTPALWARRRK